MTAQPPAVFPQSPRSGIAGLLAPFAHMRQASLLPARPGFFPWAAADARSCPISLSPSCAASTSCCYYNVCAATTDFWAACTVFVWLAQFLLVRVDAYSCASSNFPIGPFEVDLYMFIQLLPCTKILTKLPCGPSLDWVGIWYLPNSSIKFISLALASCLRAASQIQLVFRGLRQIRGNFAH